MTLILFDAAYFSIKRISFLPQCNFSQFRFFEFQPFVWFQTPRICLQLTHLNVYNWLLFRMEVHRDLNHGDKCMIFQHFLVWTRSVSTELGREAKGSGFKPGEAPLQSSAQVPHPKKVTEGPAISWWLIPRCSPPLLVCCWDRAQHPPHDPERGYSQGGKK